MKILGAGNLYRDFLAECRQSLPKLNEAHESFVKIAQHWKQVAGLFTRAGETGDTAFIDTAAALLIEIPEREQQTMASLAEATLNLA